MGSTKDIIQIFRKNSISIFLYLFVNIIFVLKYFPRVGFDSFLSGGIYTLLILFVLFSFYSKVNLFSERTFKIVYWGILIMMVLAIIGLLIYINPYTIRVDRWSALSFFWDYLLQGKYPYSTHTHISQTNYPSPFPLWQVINFPFYLLGDVGIGLVFFLLLIAIIVRFFFGTYRKSILFLIMLCLSPAYWWEVAVRSDALNNAFFVFGIILWLKKTGRSLSNNFILIALICGSVAATRLTAIIPLALYFFKPYLQLSLRKIIAFPIIVLLVFVLIFSPFIFWDTHSWIFFSRNPFMNQADKGNLYIFISMILLGCIMALKWKNIEQFFNVTSFFIFIFILVSQIGLILAAKASSNLFSDNICDISYFSLILPYCLVAMGYQYTDELKKELLNNN